MLTRIIAFVSMLVLVAGTLLLGGVVSAHADDAAPPITTEVVPPADVAVAAPADVVEPIEVATPEPATVAESEPADVPTAVAADTTARAAGGVTIMAVSSATFSPEHPIGGETMTVSGTGCDILDSALITVALTTGGAGSQTIATTDATGAFSASLAMPGTATTVAAGSEFGVRVDCGTTNQTDPTRFSLTYGTTGDPGVPLVLTGSLNPGSLYPGDTVTVIGAGCTPGSPVTVTTDDAAVASVTVISGPSGSYYADVVTDPGATYGGTLYVFVVCGDPTTTDPSRRWGGPVSYVPASAYDDDATTPVGTPVTVEVLANDLGHGMSVDSVGVAANGTVAITPDGLRVVYTPDPSHEGLDVFSYVMRHAGGTSTAAVRIQVQPAVVPPVTPPSDPTGDPTGGSGGGVTSGDDGADATAVLPDTGATVSRWLPGLAAASVLAGILLIVGSSRGRSDSAGSSEPTYI